MTNFLNKISIIDYVLRPQEVAKKNNLETQSSEESKEIIWKQVFFRPYNKKEFKESLSHLFIPGALLTIGVLFPQLLIAIGIAFLVACAAYAIIYGINKLIESNSVDSFLVNFLDYIKTAFQGAVDLLILPFSLTVMLTRGIATAVEKVPGYNVTEEDGSGLSPK